MDTTFVIFSESGKVQSSIILFIMSQMNEVIRGVLYLITDTRSE